MSDLTTYVMDRGRTRTFTVKVFASGLTSAGVNGMTFTFMAKRRKADADSAAVITKHNSDFTVVTVGNSTTDAVLTFTLTPADTNSLTDYTVLLCDVSVKDSSSEVTTLAKGVLIIDDVVTQAIS